MNSLKISILSWNTQSISIHRKSFHTQFNSEKFLTLKKYHVDKHDIICLQELQVKEADFKKFCINSLPDKKVIFSTSASSKSSHSSMAIYFNKNINLISSNDIFPGRLLKAKFNFSGTDFLVYNIYSFTSMYTQDALDLLDLLEQDLMYISPSIPIFLCGDFNCDINKVTRISIKLSQIISDFQLLNMSEHFNDYSPTWRGDGARAKSFSKIDYILTRNYNINNQRYLSIPVATSDHSLIVLENVVNFKKSEPHKFEHIKENLLEKPLFREKFLSGLIAILKKYFLYKNLHTNEELENFMKINERHINMYHIKFLDDPDFYEISELIFVFDEIFTLLADETNSLFKKIKSAKNKKFQKFKLAHINLEKSSNNENIENFLNAKTELKNHFQDLNKYQNERSRIRKIQKSSTKMNNLFSVLGRNNPRRISRLMDPVSGETTDNPIEICRIFTENYAANTTDPDNLKDDPQTVFPPIFKELLKEYNIKLSDIFPSYEQRTSDDLFSFREIKDILKATKNRSAPGPSKITKHSLLFICRFIPNLFTAYINALINKDDLSSDPMTSWIVKKEIIFIKKKSNDTLDVNSYRPISMLESIYKLISKLTISRFEKIIFSSISKSQFGFKKSKQMALASHSIIQIIERIKSKNVSAALISIDIKAAFDSARHSTLNAALSQLFPDNYLIDRIAYFAHNTIAKINVNGVIGRELKLSKGVGQGDPSSGMKYLVLHHIFSFFIEKFLEKEALAITNLHLHDSRPPTPIDTFCFADDTVLFINETLNVHKAEKLLDLYGKLHQLTGLAINTRKSNFLALNKNLTNEFISALSKLAIQKDSIEHLGVIIAANLSEAKTETFTKIEKSMQNKMKMITSSLGSVDIFTKTTLFKTMILSKPLHCFRVYTPDAEMLDRMWAVFKTALWTKTYDNRIIKKTKIAANRLTIPVKDGGLGLLHIKTNAALSMLSSFIAIMAHAIDDQNSIMSSILHKNPLNYNTAVLYLNSHYFKKFWVKHINSFFPHSNHLTEHLQKLFDTLEVDETYGLFMPILHHKFLDPRVKFLNLIRPEQFEEDGELYQFRTVASLINIKNSGKKNFFDFKNYNPMIDKLENDSQKTILKKLFFLLTEKINFKANNFTIRNCKHTMFEISAIYSTKTLLAALKKSAHKISGQNNPPPPSWVTRQRDGLIIPNLEQFQASFQITKNPQLPPSLRAFHFDFLSRVSPSLKKLVMFKNNKFNSSLCPREECRRNKLVADSEHIVFHCVFVSSILNFLREASSKKDIKVNTDEMFYLFPFAHSKQNPNFLENFILSTQIKIVAFQIITDEKFTAWNFRHFVVKLLSIIKTSIEICEMYKIPILFLHALLEYAQFAACGSFYMFLYEF